MCRPAPRPSPRPRGVLVRGSVPLPAEIGPGGVYRTVDRGRGGAQGGRLGGGRARRRRGVEFACEAGFEAELLAIEQDGRAWRMLLSTAKKHGAGAVVVGARGRSAIATALLGSVSNGLIYHSPFPVLVVPKVADPRLEGEPCCCATTASSSRSGRSAWLASLASLAMHAGDRRPSRRGDHRGGLARAVGASPPCRAASLTGRPPRAAAGAGRAA